MQLTLPLTIERQPDYTTCGPTSLHAVYSYWKDPITLPEVIAQTPKLSGGGTLSVHLAVHALKRGYRADTWVCNVAHWDPTWFQKKTDYGAKLKARMAAKGLTQNPRYSDAMKSMTEYLDLGGKVHWGDLTPRFIYNVLQKRGPILTGTNGTYLYQCARETAEGPDDVKGDAFGHFIVLRGCDTKKGIIEIADPLLDNPLVGQKYYRVTTHRLIGAIFLGASSDDSNLLLIRPKEA